MIHGVIQQGVIQPLEPIPADWDGQEVTIEAAPGANGDDRAEIERWHAELEKLGPAQYEPGEREAFEAVLAGQSRTSLACLLQRKLLEDPPIST
jgi:hypothetical protein